MPSPKDVSQLRDFLGLVNFHGNFVKNLHNSRVPLDVLTKKDATFSWTPACQSSFDHVKTIFQSDLLLTHYNPSLPIVVAADASNYGIGAVLSLQFPNGSEKVSYHAHQTLAPVQKKYRKIEKELLLLYLRFRNSTASFTCHFTLKTDHKPLISIFGNKKGVSVHSANRFQRWATTLLNYNFNIQYVNTKDFGQAGAPSRLISSHTSEPEDRVIAAMDKEITAES
ncbi:hypothetical protein TELCIR_00880 [Teladorsagia circumcincta]|uniref:RNA-directed DNA polymerase n=1 Tax=Teladorsagia circumcincta TaxID=45464 RepID=A0A2G9V3E6_TELCI|nr:hypothetical protein TELCIR_00880 [Teladorsagia circumcincta]